MKKYTQAMMLLIIASSTSNVFAETREFGINTLNLIAHKKPGIYFVQTGVFKHQVKALAQAKALKSQYSYPVSVKKSRNDKFYVVTVGPINVTTPPSSLNTVSHSQNSSNRDKTGNLIPVPSTISPHWSWVFSASAGATWQSNGKNQTFYLTPDIEKTYTATKDSQSLALGQLFVGMQKNLSQQLVGQLGVEISTTGNAKLNGTIWDDADPLFENYRYHYKVNSTRVAAKTKLLFNTFHFAVPWVSVGAGIAFNRAHSFENTPILFEALPNNNFTSNTKTALSYSLGVGVQKLINQHWSAGLAYEFSDWGKSELGRASEQTLNSGLMLNHLYSNGILFNLTYSA